MVGFGRLSHGPLYINITSLRSTARSKGPGQTRSDHDLALQKNENEVNMYKRVSEKVTEDKESARTELEETRAQAGKDKIRTTGLAAQNCPFHRISSAFKWTSRIIYEVTQTILFHM